MARNPRLVIATAATAGAALAATGITLGVTAGGDGSPKRPIIEVAADKQPPYDRTGDAKLTACDLSNDRQPAARVEITNTGPGKAGYIVIVVYADKDNPAQTYGDATQRVDDLPEGDKATAIFDAGSVMPEGVTPNCLIAVVSRVLPPTRTTTPLPVE
jgi:hypothetical protein